MNVSPRLQHFVEPMFGENAYIVWVADGGPCWLIDPGLPPSAEQLLMHVKRHKLIPDAIVLTHAHADHIAGIPEVLESFPNLPVYLSDVEATFLTDPYQNLSAAFGVSFTTPVPLRRDLAHGSTMTLAATDWQIFDTSGHSPGSRTLYCKTAGLAISGDALFNGSIGRTDFPHSDHDTLIRNIRQHLFTLPDDTTIHPGHGPSTTIGQERRTNPYVGEP